MPIGIRPLNDFAYKKTFGSPENRLVLISLLNAILDLKSPIVDVTIENPYNLQDFQNDKLSILDIKAVDQKGAIYDIEMQISNFSGLIKRFVFYGCEVYAGQLRAGDDYSQLKPVFSICLLNGILWSNSKRVHHAFRLSDRDSGRVLHDTLEIHTLELGWYNLRESDLASASMLDCWLYWLLHAHEYEADALMVLFPQEAIRKATQTITRIAEVTEDKSMYDAREKAIRDRQWALNASRMEGKIEGKIEGMIEGKIEGKIELIRTLEELLQLPLSSEELLAKKSLEELKAITVQLQSNLRRRQT